MAPTSPSPTRNPCGVCDVFIGHDWAGQGCARLAWLRCYIPEPFLPDSRFQLGHAFAPVIASLRLSLALSLPFFCGENLRTTLSASFGEVPEGAFKAALHKYAP